MQTMIESAPQADQARQDHGLHDDIQEACGRISPLWPLRNFVAVNPFLGLSDRHFLEAAALMERIGHGGTLMASGSYAREIERGRIEAREVDAVIDRLRSALPATGMAGWLPGDLESLKAALARGEGETLPARIVTFADHLDSMGGRSWGSFIVDEISKWCSAYYDQGQSSWRMPWQGAGLFKAWREAARLDANPELNGMEGFRALVSSLPGHPEGVIRTALQRLGVPSEGRADFLHRELMSLRGWSGYVQYRVREQAMNGKRDDSLVELLAIRLVYDAALRGRFGGEVVVLRAWERRVVGVEPNGVGASPGLLARYVAQEAMEQRYHDRLLARLKDHPRSNRAAGRRTLQAVFCIDVRSEVYRRSLEAQSDEIDTIGFAGFFGVPIEVIRADGRSGGARCPVLLTPGHRVREPLQPASQGAAAWGGAWNDFRIKGNDTWNSFKTSAISCFSFVETAGLWFGARLVAEAMGFSRPEGVPGAPRRAGMAPRIGREARPAGDPGQGPETGILPSDQVAIAAAALRNMGLTSGFAQVVLFCGHGSATVNNPYGSALDCGACGGHAGDANARVAAALLNQPSVRDGLRSRGIQIPPDTVFIAGLHNTTTDEVVLFDTEQAEFSHPAELGKLRAWLEAASGQARGERASSLGLGGVPPGRLAGQVGARSRDWSEVRPEWGLAGNAAFIAAPRARTRGLNLGGRVFLHDYDASQDPEGALLELIMTAPMVVASWINLQYYGSTVNNALFGSGNKVLHNVVGTFGVWQGNGGDLQPGLPLQSLHDGSRWVHEPLRLSVVIEASPAAIERVLARHPGIRELVDNAWITLFAMDAAEHRFLRYSGRRFVETAG